jgi:hypothetical protein
VLRDHRGAACEATRSLQRDHAAPDRDAGVDQFDPVCSLLEVDECGILLDCGWDTDFDEARLQPLKE